MSTRMLHGICLKLVSGRKYRLASFKLLSLTEQSSVIEINVGITCSCLLVLPAFLKRHLPPGFSSTVARLIPCCFGRGFQDSTTKTYMSGSTLSHQADRSGEFSVEPDHPKSPTSVVAYPIPGYTTLITPENLHDLESQDRGGPHTG